MFFGHRQVEQAAAQKQVGSRAERHCRTGLGQSRTFLVTQMHTVGKYRAFTQQLVVVVHVQITLALREQRLHPLDFLQVLADMGVQIHIRVFAQQLARQGQLLRGAGRREARGDGIVQAALAMPAFDQCLALAVAGFGGVGQIIRGVAVHHHLAGDQAQVQTLCGLKQGIYRLRVYAAEHQGRGGAVAQQFL